MLISVCPIRALSLAIRKSQAIETSIPPPRAKPLMAAITGFSRRSMALQTWYPMSDSSRAFRAVMPFMALMSAPAENAFSPAPVMMTAFTVSSFCTSFRAARNSWASCVLHAFKASGRFSVIVPTPSLFS